MFKSDRCHLVPMNSHIRILQVSTADIMGGAEKVAYNLHHAYQARGYPAWLVVGYKYTDDPCVLPIPNDAYRGVWARIWFSIGNVLSPLVGEVRWARRLRNWLHWIGQPSRLLEILRGHEDFESPGTWRLLDLLSEQPDIVHCHNLHRAWLPTGGYFDLRALPWISQQVPVVLTLHDEWLLSGHCAHSFDCERWKRGCGHCPDLTIYPAVRRDATAYNWQRKQEIYATKSRFYVATPSRWLMQRVEQSMLTPAMLGARVIPNGVDLSVFYPADRRAVRAALGISQDARVLLFTANDIRRNFFKDYRTMRAAVAHVAERLYGQDVLFIALGEDAPAERIGKAEVRFIPYQKDPEAVACYYQAANIYVHAALADTFPNTILEALACGTPVVATAVGGIPEQVKGLQVVNGLSSELNHHSSEEATGILVPAGDAEVMAFGIEYLLQNELLLHQIGQNAAKDACQRFDLQRQADHYLEWYSEIFEHYTSEEGLYI